jgi:type IV secretory pathway VirB3-like protein
MIAHVLGVPVEEVVLPLVSTGGVFVLVARPLLARLRPRRRG